MESIHDVLTEVSVMFKEFNLKGGDQIDGVQFNIKLLESDKVRNNGEPIYNYQTIGLSMKD